MTVFALQGIIPQQKSTVLTSNLCNPNIYNVFFLSLPMFEGDQKANRTFYMLQ